MAAAKRNSSSTGESEAKAERAFVEEAGKLNYEDALARLESIIERVERGEIGLEESLDEYRRGRALLQRCQSILDVAEQDVRRLTLADAEGLSGVDSANDPQRERGDR